MPQYKKVKDALLSRDSTSLAITGKKLKNVAGIGALGGVGKTWMAIQLAHDKEVLEAFPDGVFWATFGNDKTIAENAFEKLWLDLGGGDLENMDFSI